MFSSDLDAIRHPISTRSWGIILGSVIMVSVGAALVSARTIPFMLAATVAAYMAAAPLRGKSSLLLPRLGPVGLHLATFLLFAAASAFWSIEPGLSIFKTGLAILIMLGTIVLSQLIASETPSNLLHMGEGVWVGFLVGSLYFLVELVTDQSIKIWLFNLIDIDPSVLRPARYFKWSGEQLVSISLSDLTRNAAPIMPFLWPAALAMQGTLVGSTRTVAATGIITLAGIVVFLSPHETSKLAFLAGLAIFGCTFAAPRLVARVAAIGWVCACLAVVPAALLAYRLDLGNASWLQHTARVRIVIWNSTAEQILQAPLFGIGAHMTYVQGPKLEEANEANRESHNYKMFSRHAHNVFLQTWLELGMVGAVLLTLVGLSLVEAIRALGRASQPYAYATFASAAVVAAFSYGMWQIWFMAMFGYCVALFWIGRSLSSK